jgi:hypothetical protein
MMFHGLIPFLRTDVARSTPGFLSCRPPKVGLLFVIEMSDAGDKRIMTVASCPPNGVGLRLGCVKRMVRVVFDDIIVDPVTVRASLGSCFNVDIWHG